VGFQQKKAQEELTGHCALMSAGEAMDAIPIDKKRIWAL